MFSKDKILAIKKGFNQKQQANRMMVSNPKPKYTDLLSKEDTVTVANIPYEPKPFFTKSLMRKLRRRLLWLKILSFFGDKPGYANSRQRKTAMKKYAANKRPFSL